VLAALVLYVTLPSKLTIGPFWLFPLLVLGLLIPLSIFSPNRVDETRRARIGSIALIAILTLYNVVSVYLLVHSLIHPSAAHPARTGGELLVAGVHIWMTNILIFGLWYWEFDAGGPEIRAKSPNAAAFPAPDFQFPQMTNAGEGAGMAAESGWMPLFVDYLFLAFNTATALSPCDTMPFTRLAKILMMTESVISFATIAVIVSRSINILG
jgi:uncharacterized membrane protein